jgi:general secretion pathway protein D
LAGDIGVDLRFPRVAGYRSGLERAVADASGLVQQRRRRVALRVTVLNRAWLVATGLAAAVVLPTTGAMTTAARAQSPGVNQGSPTGSPPPGANPTQTVPARPDVDAARSLLKQSQQALEAKNTELAVTLFRQAAAASGGLEEMRGPLTEAGRALFNAGVSLDRLRPPQPTAGNPAGQPAGTSDMASAKVEVQRLIAEGRAAIDRGDAATAVALARRASSYSLPETAFAPDEPRPWQLLLDAETLARRSSGQPTALAGGFAAPGGVAQAGGFQMPAQNGGAAVQPVQAIAPIGSGQGGRLFQEGLDALSGGDRGLAREKFVEAWKYEAEMPAEVRQQLKDKLTLLQPTTPLPSNPGMPLSPMDAVDQQQQLERQRLYREISGELGETQQISTSRPMVALDRIDQLLRRVEQSSTDQQFKTQMTSIVMRARAEQQKYVDANRASIELQLRNEQVEMDLSNDRKQRSAANDKIAELVETFNQYMEERRYHEAETVAKQVQLLDPDSTIAVQLVTRSQVALRGLIDQELREAKNTTVVDYMQDVERSSIMPDPALPMHFGDEREWNALSERRFGLADSGAGLSAAEERIRQRLMSSVEVRFPNKPLQDALKTLGAVSGVPIYLDQQAFAEAQVNLDDPVNLDLQQPVMLRSALQLLLDKYDLTWMIEDEVLKITSPTRKRTNIYPRTYKVADLVIPIPNFVSGYNDGLAGALRNAYQMTAQSTNVQIAPMSPMDLAGNQQGFPQGDMNGNVLAQYGTPGMPGMPGTGYGGPPGRGGGAIADFDSLMQLIQTTIDPTNWDTVGGPSTMFPYRQNLSLVISTTTDVHEQISDLLASLRRLQNLQVTIEVRFITLSDSFYERIGIDFDVAIDDNTTNLPLDDRGPTVTVGLAGENRLLTSDLDIQFNQGSFGAAIPTFGGYTAGQGAQVGFAILSDIEAFFFLEAAQGDSRSNILQAPKVTLFDGQLANINDTVSRPFVTSIVPVVGDFAVAQQPVVVVLSEGTQLNVQAVVSDDKRFVRLTLNPMFTQINDVDTFTFEGSRRRTTSAETIDPATGEVIDSDGSDEIVVGTTVQQPSFANTSVSTTVSVPDGGTILLGGIKRLRENRNEIGVPMLSKIPYVNRLFRNVGIGRDATSLMLMVTPRIIIQEEEEVAQTGFDPTGR